MSKQQLSVFDYTDYRAFLSDVLTARRLTHPRFSLGSWAKRLKLGSSSMLVMILKGQRNPGDDLLEKLVADLKLRVREAAFFKDLVKFEKCKNDLELRSKMLERLRVAHPAKTFRLIEPLHFEAVSKWHYYAIRELVDLPSFQEDPDWISSRLRYKVTHADINKAIKTMEKLELLSRNESGKLCYNDSIGTANDIPQEGLKRFHEQILDLVQESLRSVPEVDREISGMTFTMCREDLPRAKEIISSVYRELLELSRPGRDSVYHVEIGLVPLTRRDSP